MFDVDTIDITLYGYNVVVKRICGIYDIQAILFKLHRFYNNQFISVKAFWEWLITQVNRTISHCKRDPRLNIALKIQAIYIYIYINTHTYIYTHKYENVRTCIAWVVYPVATIDNISYSLQKLIIAKEIGLHKRQYLILSNYRQNTSHLSYVSLSNSYRIIGILSTDKIPNFSDKKNKSVIILWIIKSSKQSIYRIEFNWNYHPTTRLRSCATLWLSPFLFHETWSHKSYIRKTILSDLTLLVLNMWKLNSCES